MAASSPAPAPALPKLPSADAGGELPAGVVEPVVVEIALESMPSGAEVFVDGISRGRTPLRLQRPEGGAQAIELRLAGYVSARARLTPSTPTSLRLALKRAAAQLPPKKTTPIAEPPKRGTSEVVDPWGK